MNQLQPSQEIFKVPGRHQLSLADTHESITYRRSLNAPLSRQTCLPLWEIKAESVGDSCVDRDTAELSLLGFRRLNGKRNPWHKGERTLPLPYHLETAKGGQGHLSSVSSKPPHTLEQFGSVQRDSLSPAASQTGTQQHSGQLHCSRKDFGCRLHPSLQANLMGWCCPRQQAEPRTSRCSDHSGPAVHTALS